MYNDNDDNDDDDDAYDDESLVLMTVDDGGSPECAAPDGGGSWCRGSPLSSGGCWETALAPLNCPGDSGLATPPR